MTSDRRKAQHAERALADWYHECSGYVRSQNPDRKAAQGRRWYAKYKKGWEVRLPARTEDELATLRRYAADAGFTPGRSFKKGKQLILPIYGRDQTMRFLDLAGRRQKKERARAR